MPACVKPGCALRLRPRVKPCLLSLPARPMAAFNASKLVCCDTDLITSSTPPIFWPPVAVQSSPGRRAPFRGPDDQSSATACPTIPAASAVCRRFPGPLLRLVRHVARLPGRYGAFHSSRWPPGRFRPLVTDPVAGLFGDRRQLCGSAGDLPCAVTDAADQTAQVARHLRDAC